MRKLTFLIAPLMLLWSVTTAQAAAIQLASLSGNDYLDWAQLGPEGTSVPSGTSVTTGALARTAKISNSGATSLSNYQEGSLALGDFAIGDWLLFSDFGSTSITIDFNTLVAAVGTQIQSNSFGDFTAKLELYDSASALIGGPFFVSSNNAGLGDDSNPFLGAQSDAVNIARAVFTLTASDDNTLGLLINRVELDDTPTRPDTTPVPEPATLTLLGLGGAVSALARRRRARAEQQ